MPVLQCQESENASKLWDALGTNSQSKVLNLFRKGLSGDAISPQDVFGVLPVEVKRGETGIEKVLDWLYDCFEQLDVKILPDYLKHTRKPEGGIDETIEILIPDTVEERNAQAVLGSVTFSLFKGLSISKKNCNRQKELELRNKIVQLNLGLVERVARQYAKSVIYRIGSIITKDDLFQEGAIGLMRAVFLFDYSKGIRFSSYANWWIESCIQRFLENCSLTIRIPVSSWQDIRRLRQTEERLRRILKKAPLEEELRKELGWSPEKFQATLNAINAKERVFSINETVAPTSDFTFEELISLSKDKTKIEASQFEKEFQKELNEILKKSESSLREIYCFNQRFFSERTYEEIGASLGITRERVRQLIEKTLLIIRRPENLERLEEFVGFSLASKKRIPLAIALHKGLSSDKRNEIGELLKENISCLENFFSAKLQKQCLIKYFGIENGQHESIGEIALELSILPNQVQLMIWKGINKLPKFLREEILAAF